MKHAVATLIALVAVLSPPAFSQVASCTGQPDGTRCTDGNPCTYGDVCLEEACAGGWAITCPSDACATRACNGTSTCAVLSVAPDGALCDDGNACTTGDTCTAGGCAGMLLDNGLRVVRLAPGSSTSKISWNVPPGATTFDVVRGLLGCLPASPSGVCEAPLVTNQSGSVTLDAAVPAPGTGYWYLARGRNGCGAGPWGFEEVHGRAALPEVSNGGCVPNDAASPRYLDNGLTVTDRKYCLEWEKKRNAPGLNDVNRTWISFIFEPGGSIHPDGPAFTVYLPTLNTARFARHNGWRLPSEAGRKSPFTGPLELESILLTAFPCLDSPCIDTVFGPTAPDHYVSSTYVENDLFPAGVWVVDFDSGEAILGYGYYLRAVRGAP